MPLTEDELAEVKTLAHKLDKAVVVVDGAPKSIWSVILALISERALDKEKLNDAREMLFACHAKMVPIAKKEVDSIDQTFVEVAKDLDAMLDDYGEWKRARRAAKG